MKQSDKGLYEMIFFFKIYRTKQDARNPSQILARKDYAKVKLTCKVNKAGKYEEVKCIQIPAEKEELKDSRLNAEGRPTLLSDDFLTVFKKSLYESVVVNKTTRREMHFRNEVASLNTLNFNVYGTYASYFLFRKSITYLRQEKLNHELIRKLDGKFDEEQTFLRFIKQRMLFSFVEAD